MSTKIKTTGQLREFLVNMIMGVKNGDVSTSAAKDITKLAAQVHESFYSEIKIALMQNSIGAEAKKLGDLPINE